MRRSVTFHLAMKITGSLVNGPNLRSEVQFSHKKVKISGKNGRKVGKGSFRDRRWRAGPRMQWMSV